MGGGAGGGGKNFEIYYFWGFGTFPTIFRVRQFGRLFFGYVIFWQVFYYFCVCVCVCFQNKAFYNVFLMYSLIKYSIFTIHASNLLESIKILHKLGRDYQRQQTNS